MSIDASDAISGHAEVNAKARAMAIEIGAKWKCSRVRQWVGLDDCVKRYAEARDNGQYAPCLECSSILRSLREMGCATPVNTKAPVSTEPQQEPKKIISPIPKEKPMAPKPVAKKKEVASKPAKKGTPDPVMEEVKDIVTKAAPEVKETPVSFTNPFESWTKYDPMAGRRAAALEFVAISRTSISFSAAATESLKLKDYPTMTLYHGADGKKIGVELRKDASGVLKCTNETKGRAGVKVAAQGLIKALNLAPDSFRKKRFALREIAPGFVEIDLGKEVKAA